VQASSADVLSEALLEQGAQSVSMEPSEAANTLLYALFDIAGDPSRALSQALGQSRTSTIGAPSVRCLDDEDWVRRSQTQFEPLRVGRLWVGASWHDAPAEALVVRIDPGLAFGTGSHASTRLVLAFLERSLRGGEDVLDYGCGSGILGIAAAKLGAGHVDAVDIDSDAIEVARHNARANATGVHVCFPEALASRRYDVIVANILARPLIALAPRLVERARPNARLALAGLLESQSAEVARAYAATFGMVTAAAEEGWALLHGVRKCVS
jgi:ribosomal protein L11 methyltransferase